MCMGEKNNNNNIITVIRIVFDTIMKFCSLMQQQYLIVDRKNVHNPSLHYTEIDRCQDNIYIDDDVNYRQILYSNECSNYECRKVKSTRATTFTCQFQLFALILLLLTSQSNALPITQQRQPQVNYNQPVSSTYVFQTPPPSFPVAMIQLRDQPYRQASPIYLPQNNMNTYKVYRRLPMPPPQQQLNRLPTYSNGAPVQIYDQTNFGNQQASSLPFNVQQSNEQQITLQVRRERQRRHMIDRLIVSFDEDGNGQLTKDELYTMALRINVFPKFHSYFKQLIT